MFLRSFFISVILLAAFLWFSMLNPQQVEIRFPNDKVYLTTVAVLTVLSILVGSLIVFCANLVGLGKAKISGWRRGRRDRTAREVAENVRQGANAILSGDFKRGRLLLDKALEKDPFNINTYTALADLALDEGNQADALKYLLKARELDERNREILFKLAAVYEAKNDLKGAVDVYAGVLEEDESNRRALSLLRDLHIRQGRWKDALESQQRLVKLLQGERLARETERLLYLRYEFAKLGMSLGDAEKAKQELQEIIKEKPDFTPAYVTLGETLKAEGKPEEAAELWEGTFNELGNAIFLIKLEDLFFAQEDPSHINMLINFYKRRVLDNPRDLIIRLFFGKLCLRLEMVEEAMEHFRVILDSGVEFQGLHILLAEAYRRRGRNAEAVEEFRTALGIGRTYRVPFVCKGCGHEEIHWFSICPSCGVWDSFRISAREALEAAKPVESYVLEG